MSATAVTTPPAAAPGAALRPGIPAVFLHVRDVPTAVAWYSRVLGVPATGYDGARQFCILRLTDAPGAANLLFQKRSSPEPSSQALCSFGSSDIDATYRHMRAQGVRIVREIERHGDDGDFEFADPDGNVFLACKVD